MADEPNQYLRCALECARLSQTLTDATARDTFAAMAKVWVHLAAETRKRQSKLDGTSGSHRGADRSRRRKPSAAGLSQTSYDRPIGFLRKSLERDDAQIAFRAER